jgi:hypothetical protein
MSRSKVQGALVLNPKVFRNDATSAPKPMLAKAFVKLAELWPADDDCI